MTVIAAYASPDGDNIAFGSDRLMTDGKQKIIMDSSKWRYLGDGVWYGGAGFEDAAIGMTSLKGSEWREVAEKGELALLHEIAMCNTAVNIPKASNTTELEEGLGCSAILIVMGVGMWEIGEGTTPMKVKAGTFVAVGSGAVAARAAAYVLDNVERYFAPLDIVSEAIGAACETILHCARPIDLYDKVGNGEVIHREYT